MSIVHYEKHKCDCCGKEVEVQHGGRPRGWLEISITIWHLSRGDVVYDKEVCSRKCALEMLKKIKKIPGVKPRPIICHPC